MGGKRISVHEPRTGQGKAVTRIYIRGGVSDWCNGYGVDLRLERSRVQISAVPLSDNDRGQVVHTHVPLSPSSIIMAALCNRGAIIFLPCSFFLLLSSSIFFFSSLNLSGRRLDVCHTSTHGVALVRI